MMPSPHIILQWIREMKPSHTLFLVGIDGPGGTGKTSLTNALKELESSLTVVHMDHFDLPNNGKERGNPWKKEIGEDTDWQRLRGELLIPLREGKKGLYRPYNRDAATWETEVAVQPRGVVLVEGVFAIRKELFPMYDFTLWLECPLQMRLSRALTRDGEQMRPRWENDWFPMEERYMNEHRPYMYAHKIIDTEKRWTVL